jgi:glycogen synthase
MAVNPTSPALQEAMDTLQKAGISSAYGRWLVEGSPRVLLIDVKAGFQFFEEWRQDFQALTGVLLPEEDDMSNDALVFGYLVTWFLAEVRSAQTRPRRVMISDNLWP